MKKNAKMIAVAGKGGVGKTSIAAAMVKTVIISSAAIMNAPPGFFFWCIYSLRPCVMRPV